GEQEGYPSSMQLQQSSLCPHPGVFLFGSNPRPAALKTFIAGKNDSIPIKYGIIVQNRLFYG
ncbi:hypothetical protein, partial [Yersinia pestis]|uniref:hypothetical protein n=1 Tax=Yersinia pestis TaxID=632 RepID=UPI0006ACF0B0